MARLQGMRLLAIVLLSRGAAAVTAEEYATAINVAGRQRMLSQKMSKEFLLVAKGISVADSKTNMAATIAAFDSALTKLTTGSGADSIPVPPTSNITDQLQTVSGLWGTFKALLEGNVDASPIPGSVLTDVASQSVPLLSAANAVVTLYVLAASDSGAAVPGTTVNIAGRQRMLSQRISKAALLVALDVDATNSRAELSDNIDLFATSHAGLLNGDTGLGLAATTDACTLQQMMKVTDLWAAFEPLVGPIAAGALATDGTLQEIADRNPTLLTTMNTAVGLYASASPTCSSPNVSSTEWSTVINVAGRQRMLSQKMSKEFLLVAKGIDVADNKLNLAATIALFEGSLAKLVQGSTADSLPAAPTQALADQLFVVKGLWSTFKALLEGNVDASLIAGGVLADVATQSVPLLVQSNTAVTLYVSAATTAGASVPGATVNIAGRQRMLSQRISKAALLVALDVDATNSRTELSDNINLFATSHAGLLNGDTGLGLTATTDACILQQMIKVTDLWAAFEPLVKPIADGGAASNDTLQEIAARNPTLLTTMNTAVGLYASAAPTCSSTNVSSTEWSTVINVAGRQRMLSQKMSKEFLLVAKGIEAVPNKNNLAATIALFEGSLTKLIQGSTADSLPAAPTQALADQLYVVKGLWGTFKALLEGNVDASPIPSGVLSDVAAQSVPLLAQSNAAVTLYVSAATDAGASVPGATVNIAGRQRMLSQRISKAALLVALNVSAANSRTELNSTIDLFAASHAGLLNGDSGAGLAATTDACILQQMMKVTDLWAAFEPLVKPIADGAAASDGELREIAARNPTLLTTMNTAVGLYASAAPTCSSPNVSSTEWSTVINVAGRQRMLSQKMSKEFLLVAKGIEAADNKNNLAATIALFEGSLTKLIQGSTPDSLPASPTQALADQLYVVKGLWATFKALLEGNVDASPIPSGVLSDVAAQSVPLLVQSNAAVTLYVSAATDAGASVPGATVDIAGRQRMLSQRISKAALLVALNVSATSSRTELNSTIDLFAVSHAGLLNGDSGMGLNATTDACILQQMMKVTDLWVAFEPLVKPIADGAAASDSALQDIAARNPTLLTTMNTAVGLYASVAPTCSSPNVSSTEWSTVINVAGRQRMLSQKMSKEFLLVAKGVNVTDNKNSLAATIALFEGSLTKLIQGSTPDSLPAAPTQALADQLYVVKGLWATFKALLEGNVDASPIPSGVLSDVAAQSVPLLVQSNAAVTLYVSAATDAGATVPGATVNIAGRQRMLSQRMSKEVLLIALGVDPEANRQALNSTMALFETSHMGLLEGDSDLQLVQAEHSCILQQMEVVGELWVDFKAVLQPIVDGGNATDAALSEIAELNPILLGEANDAVTLFAADSPECENSTGNATTTQEGGNTGVQGITSSAAQRLAAVPAWALKAAAAVAFAAMATGQA